jgi:hypothetical protein
MNPVNHEALQGSNGRPERRERRERPERPERPERTERPRRGLLGGAEAAGVDLVAGRGVETELEGQFVGMHVARAGGHRLELR